MPRDAEWRKTFLFAVRTVLCQERVDMVAAWRRKNGDDQQRGSTIEGACANTNLPIPHGRAPLWRPGGVPGERADVCGSVKPPNTDGEWEIRCHAAFEINRDVLGIRPTDQSYLSHANAWPVDHYRSRNAVRSEQDRRQGKQRGNPYDHM